MGVFVEYIFGSWYKETVDDWGWVLCDSWQISEELDEKTLYQASP